MTDDAVKLNIERLESGAALLRMLDSVSFEAVGAAWVYTMDTDLWHYLLITPMVDTKGPYWIYERLLKVFAKLRLPNGITPLDIVVASPYEQAFQKLRLEVEWDGHIRDLMIPTQDIRMDGLETNAFFAYRLQLDTSQTSDGSRKFDLRVRQLMAA